MANQQIVIDGHTYQLWAAEYYVNCDYIVELEPTQPPMYVVGKLMWMGTGTTNFSYKVTDVYNSTVGIFSSLQAAMNALDSWIYS